MILAIKCSNQQFNLNESSENNYLTDFQLVNVFVGVNNSGKSQFMRQLFSNGADVEVFNKNEVDSSYNSQMRNSAISLLRQVTLQLPNRTLKELDKVGVFESLRKEEKNLEDYHNIFKSLDIIDNINHEDIRAISGFNVNQIVINLKKISNDFESRRKQIRISGRNNHIYIPVLRGLRPVYQNGNNYTSKDIYKSRTIDDYFDSKTISNNIIYTGLSIYEDVQRLLLGDEKERELIGDFQLFLGQKIFDEKVILIPKYDDDVLHIKVGNSRQREIYNLGDGIQSIILILFVCFINRNRSCCIFIEEPELHLHPKWQRKLIAALLSINSHQYFFSTHSASFINIQGSSLYRVYRKNKVSIVKYTELNSDRRIALNDLGYLASDLFQTNFILWVEGPSDQEYVQSWIKQINPELELGIHYSILFFGGSVYKNLLFDGESVNIDKLSEVNQNFGIILDSDRTNLYHRYSDEKRKLKEKFEELGYYCWITKYREIENYIPDDLYRDSVIEIHKVENISIANGFFEDRCKVIDNNSGTSVKSKIKLPNSIFSQIQKNADGSTKSISCRDLREAIEEGLLNSSKRTFNIDKLKIAKAVKNRIDGDYEWIGESKDEIKKLCNIIGKVN